MQDANSLPDLSFLPSGSINPVPNHDSASTLNFDYLLVDGIIYFRSRTPEDPKTMDRGKLKSVNKDDPNALAWKIYDELGVPYGEDKKSLLAADEKIVEIAVASEIIVAVSNLNRVYLFKPTEKKDKANWEHLLGAPDFCGNDKLFLPEDRIAWAFSCSVCFKPETRTTEFMNDNEIVTYFTDANGVRFDFGFTATIYVLTKDRKKIVYWDTGLPASFSRGFLVPDGFQGVDISAAGSTVFLSAIDAAGKLHFFTRMIDYEVNGACPGLKVDYTDIPVIPPPGGPDKSYFLGFGVRKAPLNGWVERKMDDEILPNITSKVAIRLTGKGDAARELRMAGKDPKLGSGYYYKNIFDEGPWKFQADATVLEKSNSLAYDTSLLPNPKMSYNCIDAVASNAGMSIELKDFNPFLTDSDATYLVINMPGEPSQYVRIYAVDAWGLDYHNKHDEDLVGTVDGEPKALMGTLMLTPEQLKLAENPNSAMGAFIKKHFLDYHGKTKAIRIIADNHRVVIRFDLLHDFTFKRTITEAEINASYYMGKALDPKLCAMPKTNEQCTDLINKNQDCLKEIKSFFQNRRLEDGKLALHIVELGTARPFASAFFKIYPKPGDPTYKQAVADIDLPLQNHLEAITYAAMGKSNPQGYNWAVSLLKRRIKLLQGLLDKFPEQTTTSLGMKV